MLNTVFRQVSFFLFERKLHDMRAKGELSDEDISELWMNSQKESLGESIIFQKTTVIFGLTSLTLFTHLFMFMHTHLVIV